ncbi:MAG: prepilin-type N-terminal cleavage/methylation domain-containing protein, partial [Candidatus Omnitrophica bacterium]|nr:prepilin-type N-terminal cleavage/methylation domain-containing protein [Candidatus Omnitrophota bacterium]
MKNKGFTPLEKATDEVSGEKNIDADGSLMPPSAETVSPIKNNISNGIKGRSSLTGFTLIELMLVVIIIGTLAALV